MISNYVLFRQLLGVLFLLDFLCYLPNIKNILGEGYRGPGPGRKIWAIWALMLIWLTGIVSLTIGFLPLLGALVLWILFRLIYVHSRWTSLFRGGGAPGFMSHHAVMFVCFFELSYTFDTSSGLARHFLTMYQIDFGVILLCSGAYKSLSGYLKGEGMEYGLVNPFWSYFPALFKNLSATNPFFIAQDRIAAIGQIVTGSCLIIPPLRPFGAVLCIFAFLYLLLTVRLGRLAALMMIYPLLYLPDLALTIPGLPESLLSGPQIAAPRSILNAIHALITLYLILLPVVKITQYLNHFGAKQLWHPLQRLITMYANFIPIIMWRVFTPDVTNFFVRIYRADRSTGREVAIVHEDTTFSYFALRDFWWKMRFLNVTESIAIASVFTTARYFSSNLELFNSKLVRYARTLVRNGEQLLRFEFVAIEKGPTHFEYVPAVNFIVDLVEGTVREEKVLRNYSYKAPAKHSHIKETTGYGSYVPKS